MMSRKYYRKPYSNRNERNDFIVSDLKEFIGNSVLNLGGGGEKYLKRCLPKYVPYFEIDITGEPDLKLDLEKDIPLPLDDNSFDTVICTDVLEHLENIHEVFSELARISKNSIIISLPNPFISFFSYFRNKPYKGGAEDRRLTFGSIKKYYGIPYEKPPDRHKWFFSYTEAEDFLEYQAKKSGLRIEEMFGLGYYSNKISGKVYRALISLLWSQEMRKNVFCSSLWCVLGKL